MWNAAGRGRPALIPEGNREPSSPFISCLSARPDGPRKQLQKLVCGPVPSLDTKLEVAGP